MSIKHDYEKPRLSLWVDQLSAWKNGKNFSPIRVNISPAGNCNHRCRFCYVDYLKHPNFLIGENILSRLCRDLAEIGVKQIMCEGIGEPLLNKGTIGALNLAAARGIFSRYLVTNGVLLTPDVTESFIESLTERDMIRISAPEATPELYAITHGCSESEWHKLMENLDWMKSVRKNGTLIITVYPTCDTPGTLREAVQMSIDKGADIVSVTPPILKAANAETQDYRQDLRKLHEEELNSVEELSTDKCLVLVNHYWFDVMEGDKKPVCCDGIDFYTCVGPDAHVYPCFRYWLNKEYSYGDLNKDSFRNIWTSSKRKSVRSRVLAQGPDDGTLCRNCAHTRMNKYLDGIKNPSRFSGAI